MSEIRPAEASANPRPSPLFRQAAALYLVLAVVAIGWIGSREELDWGILLSPTWPIDLAIGLACGGGFLALWAGLRRVLPALDRVEARLAGLLVGLHRDEAIALAFFSAVAEELLFRGAMLPAWGLAVSTLLFGLLHVGPGRELRWWTALALACGLGLGLLASSRGALLAPIVAHWLINVNQLPRLAARAASDHQAPAGLG